MAAAFHSSPLERGGRVEGLTGFAVRGDTPADAGRRSIPVIPVRSRRRARRTRSASRRPRRPGTCERSRPPSCRSRREAAVPARRRAGCPRETCGPPIPRRWPPPSLVSPSFPRHGRTRRRCADRSANNVGYSWRFLGSSPDALIPGIICPGLGRFPASTGEIVEPKLSAKRDSTQFWNLANLCSRRSRAG